MSYARALREAEQQEARLKAEYSRALASFTAEQLLEAENVARLSARLHEAEATLQAKVDGEAAISTHPGYAALAGLQEQLSLIAAAIPEAEAEAVAAGDFSMRRALKLAHDWREGNARAEALRRGLESFAAKQRAQLPAESEGELQQVLHRAQRRFMDACAAERVRLACLANPEFLRFTPGALGSIKNL